MAWASKYSIPRQQSDADIAEQKHQWLTSGPGGAAASLSYRNSSYVRNNQRSPGNVSTTSKTIYEIKISLLIVIWGLSVCLYSHPNKKCSNHMSLICIYIDLWLAKWDTVYYVVPDNVRLFSPALLMVGIGNRYFGSSGRLMLLLCTNRDVKCSREPVTLIGQSVFRP